MFLSILPLSLSFLPMHLFFPCGCRCVIPSTVIVARALYSISARSMHYSCVQTFTYTNMLICTSIHLASLAHCCALKLYMYLVACNTGFKSMLHTVNVIYVIIQNRQQVVVSNNVLLHMQSIY